MILEVLTVGLVISACLAIFIDEAVYSVVALAGTFFFTSLLYALNDALLAAIFQFAVGVGTLAVLFLSGEMLTGKPAKETKSKNILPVAIYGLLLSLPAVILSVFHPAGTTASVSFGEALWNLRAADVVLQGLVILVVAVGIGIVLHEKRKGEK